MTGTVFWWTGATVWVLVALAVVAAIGEVLHALAVTISWLRFVCAVSRVKGVNRFKGLPTILFVRWWHFIGWRKGREAWEGPEGYWWGIGDWNVTPPNAEVRGDAPLYGAASLSTDGLCSTVEAEK